MTCLAALRSGAGLVGSRARVIAASGGAALVEVMTRPLAKRWIKLRKRFGD